MSKIDVTERLTYLAEKFQVFECKKDEIEAKCEEMKNQGWQTSEPVFSERGGIIGIKSTKLNEKRRTLTHIGIHYEVFSAMIGADPTPNKICVQWMLNVIRRHLRNGENEKASRFAFEDLPQANEYITLFEANKRKKKFREMAAYSLKGFKDITNINEYRDLSQLFDAVDPFIERDSTEVESMINKYIKMGQGEIPFKDRRFTIFIPLSRDANVIFDSWASWCTAKSGNGMFENYVNNNKSPDGSKSKIYIVINNGFFEGKNENIYQLHFESGQVMNRSNRSDFDFYDEVLSKSDGVRNYFGEVLLDNAKKCKKSIDNNRYIDMLIDFGFTEALFDMYDSETPLIRIDSATARKKRKVPTLPDLRRFKDVGDNGI